MHKRNENIGYATREPDVSRGLLIIVIIIVFVVVPERPEGTRERRKLFDINLSTAGAHSFPTSFPDRTRCSCRPRVSRDKFQNKRSCQPRKRGYRGRVHVATTKSNNNDDRKYPSISICPAVGRRKVQKF